MRRQAADARRVASAATVLLAVLASASPAHADRPRGTPTVKELVPQLQAAAWYAQSMLAGGLIDPPEREYGPFPAETDPDPAPSLAFVSGGWSEETSSFCFDGRARVDGKTAWFKVDDVRGVPSRGRCRAGLPADTGTLVRGRG